MIKEIKMNKARLNYTLDAVIGVAFAISAVTGMAFLLMGSGGYQGGRNPNFRTALLGISREAWNDLHTWASMVMIAGVVVHLVLHWKWIVCVTKQMLPARRRRSEEVCEVVA
jgi:asparagine N-glycosylation enzyme membrane subunit Stt3